ncbi:serine O-acetyltransferase EpsC [Variovorax ginsengisoli]|uniref:Serine acetyltransferase n=1 Tax=Variovorax ginsengisoli TaxID=363844 RepID=A0ABT9SFJ4_9BURK|nr:serine O-acetyltransferase EpsC [Variovorax ginsengisoli]MDP9903005.1 serine O-acetyltransferase [Variovorax ginsengisoli]
MIKNRPAQGEVRELWRVLRSQAEALSATSPCVAPTLQALVLDRQSFEDALSSVLVQALAAATPTAQLKPAIDDVLAADPDIAAAAAADLVRLAAINPACPSVLTGLLSFRGYQAIQLYRINHALWSEGRQELAVLLQNWGATVFAMDIHPGAVIGRGVFFDHGVGTVIGATAVVEDGVNIWHGVTLGSTLTQAGDRHPKVRRNATIGAGATILGNIEIGAGAVVAAGTVVLKSVEPGTVVAGIPARVMGKAHGRLDAIDESMKHISS